MKKLITVILAILISLIPTLTAPQPTDSAELSTVTISAEQTAESEKTELTVCTEGEPETIEAEPPVTPIYAPCAEIPTDAGELPTVEETSAVSDQNEETVEPSAEEVITEPESPTPVIEQNENKPMSDITEEETSGGAIRIDGGNNNFVPYTPADGLGTPNPFEGDLPNQVIEINVEELLQPGDDRPGEGIHF